jgi:transcriptional regulator with XRE-family HTH domain
VAPGPSGSGLRRYACKSEHGPARVSTDPKERWLDLGSFIREQRGSARLSLRRLSELAGISNPYLSQIERGLRRPSAEILQQIAKALRISAETLYVQAGILEAPSGSPDLTRAIMADQSIGEEQKQALVRIYLSFRRDHEDERGEQGPGGPVAPAEPDGAVAPAEPDGAVAPAEPDGPTAHVASA